MKSLLRLLSLMLLLALLAGLLAPAQAATPSTVTVISYNLKNSNYSFGNVSSMVKDNGADLVCMQEVCSLQYLGLNTAMGLAGYSVTLGKSSGANSILEADEYLPIYYQSSKYKEMRCGTFWLSNTGSVQSKFDESSYFRICTWAYYQIIGTDDYIIVFNTHLDFALDVLIRQLDILLKQIIVKTEELNKAWDHVILTGDLNCSNTSVVCKYLQGDTAYNGKPNLFTKQRLDEARQIAASTFPNANGNYYTQPSSGPTMDLDHIYVTSAGFHCDSYGVISDAAGSDHLPVVAKLRFKTSPDHNLVFRPQDSGTHRASCSLCDYKTVENCSYMGDYCSLCGSSRKAQTFTRVTSLDEITTGRYLMVSAATGTHPGSCAFYAGSVYGDSGFNAMQSVGMGFAVLPDSITLEPSEIPPLVWYLSGDANGFTLGDADGNTLNHKERDLYLNKNAATVWAAGYSSSMGHCAIRENNTYYLSLRTDLDTIGHTDTAAPLFGCVNNTDTGNYKIFLYRDTSYCAHTNLSFQTHLPTCTEQGYTVYSCPDCSYNFTTDFLPAIGHSYSPTVTPPTEEAQGYTTYTCSNCGDSYTDNYTDPIYTLSFSVPAGVAPIDPIKNTQELILPEVNGLPYLAPAGAQFLGWVTAENDAVHSSEYERYIFKSGVRVTISANVTLHALYSYHEGDGVAERSFTLHDGSRGIRIGDLVLLAAAEQSYAMSAEQSGSARIGIPIQKSEDGSTIVITTEPVGIFTVGWGVAGSSQTGQLSLKDEKGYLRITDPSTNTLGSSAALDSSGSWALSRNTTTNAIGLTSQGASKNHIIRYNTGTNTFAGYSAGQESAIHLYYLSGEYDPTLYYATRFPLENCPHPESHLQNSRPAGCETVGYTGDSVCTVCSKVMQEGSFLPATGHSYSYSSNADGTHLYTCSRCEDSELQNCIYTDGVCVCGATATAYDPNLRFSNHSLSLASSIKVNFVIKNEYLVYDSYRIVIEKELYDTLGSVTGVSTYEFSEFGVYNASFSKIVLQNIAATEMCSELRATIYGYKNGIEYAGDTDVYSVQAYTLSQLNKSSSTAKLKTLCVDLLNYGTAAQIYKDYNIVSLANAPLTEEMQGYASDPASLSLRNIKSQTDRNGGSPVFFGNALQMRDKVEIMYVFPIGENIYIDVSYTASSGELVTKRYMPADFIPYGTGYYSITVDSLNASEMSIPVTAKLYCNNAWQSTCIYSIESYCAGKVGADTALGACCTMMMLYGRAAEAYFQ